MRDSPETVIMKPFQVKLEVPVNVFLILRVITLPQEDSKLTDCNQYICQFTRSWYCGVYG